MPAHSVEPVPKSLVALGTAEHPGGTAQFFFAPWRALDTPLSTDRLVHRPLGVRTVNFGTIKISAEGEFFLLLKKLPLKIHGNGLEICKILFFQSQ